MLLSLKCSSRKEQRQGSERFNLSLAQTSLNCLQINSRLQERYKRCLCALALMQVKPTRFEKLFLDHLTSVRHMSLCLYSKACFFQFESRAYWFHIQILESSHSYFLCSSFSSSPRTHTASACDTSALGFLCTTSQKSPTNRMPGAVLTDEMILPLLLVH